MTQDSKPIGPLTQTIEEMDAEMAQVDRFFEGDKTGFEGLFKEIHQHYKEREGKL